jgi:SAM-dependent methyltransferase
LNRVRQPLLLNIGCGRRFHAAWINADLRPSIPEIQRVDIRHPLPFPDASYDAVYHSHVLEHLHRGAGERFMCECARILRPGGVLRVAVPDLETIARGYLTALEAALRGDAGSRGRYDWMLLELIDQMVRERPGGEMGDYLRRTEIPNEEFVIERIGAEGRDIIDEFRTTLGRKSEEPVEAVAAENTDADNREAELRRLLGSEFRLLELGRFRRSGEIHQHMYDRFSLSELMKTAGLIEMRVVTAVESMILDWSSYELDADPDGNTWKPDSLFMEAVRPL